jgi:MFS family permease
VLSDSGIPRGFGALIAAQFASALADNALLIVAIALLAQQGLPVWWAPLLKFGFMASYVLLAPFVGPLADRFAKGAVMAAMNAVKLVGVAALLAGAHPVAALAVVGFAAAAYAPAKYGLVTELVGPARLVAANGWLEVSVVCAVLLGTVAGGALVAPAWLATEAARSLAEATGSPAGALSASLLVLMLVYAASALLNLGVPRSGARYARNGWYPADLVASFRRANRTLWRDPDGAISLAATTVFWGAGATLQIAVLRWADVALGLGLDRAAYLQAAVAAGVIVGAAAAGRWVPLHRARQMLGLGVLLGAMLPLAAQVSGIVAAVVLLVAVGIVGGAMVVPLNALLQHRGHVLLSAGRSIAVQGFNENLSVLAMLATFAALEAAQVPIRTTLAGLGIAVAVAIGALVVIDRRRSVVTPGGGPAGGSLVRDR